MARKALPTAERLTARDALQIVLGVLMVPLGVIIVVRVCSLAPSVLGVIVGTAFVGFGVHRLWLAGSRLRQLYGRKRS
ncbi:MAG: hypothetical protein ACP5SI_04755 [Chloroflexia bacterium]